MSSGNTAQVLTSNWIVAMNPLTHLKKFLPVSLLIALFASHPVLADKHFKVDEQVSSVSFATTKLQYVIEPASITGLTGEIDDSGTFNLEIPIANIQTGVAIRNERLNKLFFNSKAFPSAKVSVNIPAAVLSADLSVTQQELPATVTLFGKSRDIKFNVNIVKASDVISVSTVAPVIVRGSSFGIPTDNLAALAKTVGGIPISDTVPVSFSLVLTR